MRRLEGETTPALVLDRVTLERNCRRMIERCRALGVRLRPHMKTLKAIDAARLAIDPSHGGIAVATLNEAEYFAAQGIEDIQYAVCIAPDKLDRAAAILRLASRFSFFLDSVDTARMVAAYTRSHAVSFRVWLEVDSGEHRTGFSADDPQMLEAAKVLLSAGVVVEGVATHGGHSYRCRTLECIAAVAESERITLLEAAANLRRAGIEVRSLSAGSTPTVVHARTYEGITEVRPGVYMAGDLFQHAIDVVTSDAIALTVLATVISHKRSRNQIVIDAGGLALSKDRSTAVSPVDRGYGWVLDLDGRPSFGDLVVTDVHQEHGEIVAGDPALFERLPIGAKVRVAPNHACMTAAMYESYLVVAGSRQVSESWARTNGWSAFPIA